MKTADRSPVRATDIPEEWIELVGEIIRRDGQAMRAGAGCCIEVQSINTGEFQPMGLPAGGTAFVNQAERDLVLERLIGRATP